MKKKIVYFLCDIGQFKIAYKISPSIVGMWKGEKIVKGIKDSIEEVTSAWSELMNAIYTISTNEDD